MAVIAHFRGIQDNENHTGLTRGGLKIGSGACTGGCWLALAPGAMGIKTPLGKPRGVVVG
jgi:hypothetical protein